MLFDYHMTSPSSLMNSQFHPVCPKFRPLRCGRHPFARNRLDGIDRH